MTQSTPLPKLINPDDLKSSRHLIFLKNETSQTEILDHHEFRLIEILDSKIVLEGPPKCAQVGHQIQIFFLPRELKTKLTKIPTIDRFPDLILIVGRISLYELNDTRTRAQLHIEFTQYNLDDWEKIKNVYKLRQESIEQIIKAGNGDDK